MKKFFLKLFLFIGIVCIAQFFIWKLFPFSPPSSVNIVNTYSHIDIVYFGDSSLKSVAKKDPDQRSMYTMLGDIFPQYIVQEFQHDSYQPEIYALLAKEISYHKDIPTYIIVPINLRAFSPEWDLRPGFQFNDEKVYLEFMHTPLAPFLGIISNFEVTRRNADDEAKFAKALVYDGDTIVGNAAAFEDTRSISSYSERLKHFLVLFYMYRLHENHRKFQSLITIGNIFKKTDTKVIFYITPIDYQTGEKYIGKRFTQQIQENTALLRSILQKQGQIVIDLSLSLPTNYFIWPEEGWYVNEHINSEGKLFVVQEIAKKIK